LDWCRWGCFSLEETIERNLKIDKITPNWNNTF